MSERKRIDPMPKGVVAIFVSPDGRVVASGTDFDVDRPGGYKLQDAQRVRAERRLARAVVDAYCSSTVTEALSEYDREQMMRKLPGKIAFVYIGQEEV